VHWIIGTAGHIDHGKTSLIKALTGQDTDRLAEEKERGISIDLGFAHFDLPGGHRAGVVDVPGHERFIRNMLAGAHGIDLVLFTVAADDGVMPQTEEHLDILHLLGVERAIFIITKADLASEQRIAEVAEEVRILTAGTSLEAAPILPFSFVTGAGLDELKRRIVEELDRASKRTPGGYFRLPVDRAFLASGHGLIVTGTAVSGEVRLGDKVRCLPGDEILRVRSIEVHNETVEAGGWGQRLALNLAGTKDAHITRGDVICHEKTTLVSERFDARLEVRPTARGGIKAHQRVRVHLGTAERLGKVVPLGSKEKRAPNAIGPRESAYCQIVLTEPLQTMRGDRFIVRDETARRTLGGGIVIHAAAGRHGKRESGLGTRLEALDRGDEAALVETLIADSGEFAVALGVLAQLMNRREEDVRPSFERMNGLHLFNIDGDLHYALAASRTKVASALLDGVRTWHAAHPLAVGLDVEEARAALPVPVPGRIFRMLVQELEQEQRIVRDGSLLHLPDHRTQVPDRDRLLVERITALLKKTPIAPPDVKQLGADLSLDRHKLIELLRLMERQGSIVAVAPDFYFLRTTVDQLKADLGSLIAGKDSFTAAEFRDRFQTSRKYAIPLLEYLDREGITVRTGEVRRMKRPRLTESA
jgi:selenocysteine-specific elongation factor